MCHYHTNQSQREIRREKSWQQKRRAATRFGWRSRMIFRSRPSWGRFFNPARLAVRNWSRHRESPAAVTPGFRKYNSRSPPRSHRQTISTCRRGGRAPFPLWSGPSWATLRAPADGPGGAPPCRSMVTPPGMSLFCPNWVSPESSTKLGAMLLNAWNSEKSLPFWKILCYYLGLK